ncbi:hypothetical protein TPAR_04608 [Tolypocladium paradoxum]|uniref:Uncharacterized protein n=1 Tax=Tolypocladium paradoxum TaxID=94208 RepID=A0A2S4KYB9_9HYPO|nr:hypothetical protein TPAR_04608 [Tolypocladium paradoxum]
MRRHAEPTRSMDRVPVPLTEMEARGRLLHRDCIYPKCTTTYDECIQHRPNETRRHCPQAKDACFSILNKSSQRVCCNARDISSCYLNAGGARSASILLNLWHSVGGHGLQARARCSSSQHLLCRRCILGVWPARDIHSRARGAPRPRARAGSCRRVESHHARRFGVLLECKRKGDAIDERSPPCDPSLRHVVGTQQPGPGSLLFAAHIQ